MTQADAASAAGKRIAAVVPAAGASRRYGTPKQLTQVSGEPLIRHTVRNTLGSPVDEVVVVLGHAEYDVRRALAGLPVRFAVNPDPAAGLGSSIAAGIAALGPDTDAAIVVLGDTPLVAASVIESLRRSYEAEPAPIIQPEYRGGLRAPPTLFGRETFPELIALSGDRGARAVVEHDPARVRVLPIDRPPPIDVDTPADRDALERSWKTQSETRAPGNVAQVIGPAILFALALLALFLVPISARPANLVPRLEFMFFGFVVGAYGTMVGAGGGFLIVPALLLVYHATPELAAGTSITVVFLNALSGTLSYAKQRRVDYGAGIRFSIATLPGAIAGAWLARLFSGPLFDTIFGILLLAVAALLVWRPVVQEEIADSVAEEAELPWWQMRSVLVDRGGEIYRYSYNLWIGLALSFVVGFISSILGIGGGIIHVPVLIHLMGFPPHLATATSHFILAVSAGTGALSHFALGHVLIGPALFMGVGAIAGAQLGARLAHQLKGSRLVRLLSLALILVGLRLLLR